MTDQRTRTAPGSSLCTFPDPTSVPTLDDLFELRDAFEEWIANHGVVWFPVEQRVAEAIADTLGVELGWDE